MNGKKLTPKPRRGSPFSRQGQVARLPGDGNQEGEPQLNRQAIIAGRLLLLYALVWIFEGALRKWFLPSLGNLLFFARVPVIAAMTANAMRGRSGRLPTGGVVAVLLLVSLSLFACLHIIVGGQTVTSAVLGLRLYVEPWLVPLCLAPYLTRSHAQSVLRAVAALSVPLAALALLQVNRPRNAFVNRIFTEGGSDNFGLTGDTIRATSTFTSSFGHSFFSTLCVAAAVALFLQPQRRRDTSLALIAGPASALMVLTSGSRGALLGSIVPLLVLFFAQTYRRPELLPRLLAATGATVLGAVFAAPRLAPKAVEGLSDRFGYTGAGTELQSRSLGAYTDWITRFSEPDLAGVGLAALSQGLTNRVTQAVDVEGELIRQLFELGPALFLVTLFARVAVCAYLVHLALRRFRDSADAMPLVVAGAALNTWLSGPATGQGSVSGFVAVTASLVLAARHPVRNQRESNSR